jgi:hypothetical protein
VDAQGVSVHTTGPEKWHQIAMSQKS